MYTNQPVQAANCPVYNRSNNPTAAIKPDSHDRQTDRQTDVNVPRCGSLPDQRQWCLTVAI